MRKREEGRRKKEEGRRKKGDRVLLPPSSFLLPGGGDREGWP